MSDVFSTLSAFHFLRPWWLLVLPLALLVWWGVRSRLVAKPQVPGGVAPHLAAALMLGKDERKRWLPVDSVTLCVVLVAAAAAGPAWTRVADPLAAQTAPLAIAFQMSEAMTARDIAPSRLERAKHKILDVLATRTGGRTALIAYAGTAHRVAPLTEDPEVLKPFLEGLAPDIMPKAGANATAALEASLAALKPEPTPGAVLFVSASFNGADVPAIKRHLEAGGVPVVILAVTKSEADFENLSRLSGVETVSLTPEKSDVERIERRLAAAYRDALAADKRQKWDDKGWLLAWPAAFIALFWFRRGSTMRWMIPLVAALSLSGGGEARAGVTDWFFTPDQQGRLAYEEKRYEDAAEKFQDPAWQGHALYRAGKYEEAAEVFSRIDTAEAAIAEGMAHIRSRGYRDGVRAFETALERDPGNALARRNLEIARAIVDTVETAREQSDTGEEAGIGADDIVFDNESGRGAETQITDTTDVQPQTADQWMRTVDTRVGDFLRARFALETVAKPESEDAQ